MNKNNLGTTANLPFVLKKKKILLLSDHPLAPSGVGIQARMLVEGLIRTGKYSFKCLGGAIKHPDYNIITVNQDFVVKPVDNFGTRENLRVILMTEKPDAMVIFTDPRQFIWLWEIEDEIHQICPIAYWHVWDNDPYPVFNGVWYESTDLINCLSWKTYELVKDKFPEKTNYIPHSFPKSLYFSAPEDEVQKLKKNNFGDRADWFFVLWVSRNAARKMPSDLMEGWKLFLDKLEAQEGHRKACLIMHTDPTDASADGPNLLAVQELLGIQNNVMFSTEKLDFQQMNLLHNITDAGVNISKAEGFGLGVLISLQCGKPVLALKTGGLTRQVVDHRNGTELGAAIKPSLRKLVGSQMVPYIYEDYASQEDVANGFMKIYKLRGEEKQELKKQILDYVDHEFSFDKMIADWDRTLSETIENWHAEKETRQRWSVVQLNQQSTEQVVDSKKNATTVPSAPRFKKLSPSEIHHQTGNEARKAS